jgi:hypothetical protein
VKKLTLSLALLAIVSSFLQAYNQAQSDEELFQKAKILIFDKKWEKAQRKLDDLLVHYPKSPLYSQALFYKGKCLAEQDGKERKAIDIFKKYIRHRDADKNLIQESEIEILDLSYHLFENGIRSYSKEIEKALQSRDKAIRYYAAFKLSYISDEKTARKGLPVLENILEKEEDPELRERAKLAVLRIDPNALKDIEEQEYETQTKMLCIRIYNTGEKEANFSLNIPWALADLALSSIPEEEKQTLREEGYDLDGIMEKLANIKGNILEIKDEDTIIKIRIK